MFRKLITNLSFSPSLIGEVALYAKQLNREERLRRAGVILLLPAMILQILAIVKPPESTNTASPYDLIYGGVETTEDLLQHYDKNELYFRDIISSLGIHREELQNTHPGILSSRMTQSLLAVGAQPRVDTQEGGMIAPFEKYDGGTGSLHFTPMKHYQAHPTTYSVLSGSSQRAGEFHIIKDSGAIILKDIPNTLSLQKSDPFTLSKRAYNNTQNQEFTTAKPSDRITYTLSAKNTDKEQTQSFTFAENLSDILEYADVINTHGGTLDTRAQTISWPVVELAPEETQHREFTVRLKPHLPATAVGVSNPHSFDCIMKNSFGNSILTPVECPPSKLVERAVSELPDVASSTAFTISVTIAIVTLFLYIRSLHYKEEVRLIRRDVNEGVLL